MYQIHKTISYYLRKVHPQVNHRAETVEEVMNGFSISAQHSEIASGSADVFQMLPSTYDPDFKNPCWFKNQTIKCLPYFNILGEKTDQVVAITMKCCTLQQQLYLKEPLLNVIVSKSPVVVIIEND